MTLIRAELGDDAIIVSTQRAAGDGGVRITAAIEESTLDRDIERALDDPGAGPGADTPAPSAAYDPRIAVVQEALGYHGAPRALTERLAQAVGAAEAEAPLDACTAALADAFAFAPLPARKSPRPFLMVGPPGAGKTITVAKLAARARLINRPVGVITADSVRAGAMAQLAAFTRILEVDLKRARGPESLRFLVEESIGLHDLVFIDSPGINPFSAQDMAFLKELIEAADVEPILVLAAGIDPMEGAEAGESFAQVGATRLLATRLDMARRLGGILAAADRGQLMFSEVTISPHVANGLVPLAPQALAKLILPRQDEDEDPTREASADVMPQSDRPPFDLTEAVR
ncbi:GTP-binding protein [Roseospira visakhapatnamensis]|uniref:Flagellar biosynthesis protein FlhF n=1 Tax=Roseospira visakhapatnamensis TaxID=390880 RepID=A0A7W6W9F4_9PROT|nr:GTP-binding protein [Roseospira visakhapatnamensis]MBB4265397.1 flagellar biosynthesis protein FlhF [Roseospira visakhapatnamensis]